MVFVLAVISGSILLRLLCSTSQDPAKAQLLEKHKPVFTFDHLVRERYPTFVDALRDIDDALCMTHLYAMLPVGTCKVHLVNPSLLCFVKSSWRSVWFVCESDMKGARWL